MLVGLGLAGDSADDLHPALPYNKDPKLGELWYVPYYG